MSRTSNPALPSATAPPKRHWSAAAELTAACSFELAEVEKAMEAWLAVAREDRLPIPEPRYHVARCAASG
jgi:hypothetical protein